MNTLVPTKQLNFEFIAHVLLQFEGKVFFEQRYTEINQWSYKSCARKITVYLLNNKPFRIAFTRQLLSQTRSLRLPHKHNQPLTLKPYDTASYVCWCAACQCWLSDYYTLSTHIYIHDGSRWQEDIMINHRQVAFNERNCEWNARNRSQALNKLYDADHTLTHSLYNNEQGLASVDQILFILSLPFLPVTCPGCLCWLSHPWHIEIHMKSSFRRISFLIHLKDKCGDTDTQLERDSYFYLIPGSVKTFIRKPYLRLIFRKVHRKIVRRRLLAHYLAGTFLYHLKDQIKGDDSATFISIFQLSGFFPALASLNMEQALDLLSACLNNTEEEFSRTLLRKLRIYPWCS